jgi:hypothetical protein
MSATRSATQETLSMLKDLAKKHTQAESAKEGSQALFLIPYF